MSWRGVISRSGTNIGFDMSIQKYFFSVFLKKERKERKCIIVVLLVFTMIPAT